MIGGRSMPSFISNTIGLLSIFHGEHQKVNNKPAIRIRKEYGYHSRYLDIRRIYPQASHYAQAGFRGLVNQRYP